MLGRQKLLNGHQCVQFITVHFIHYCQLLVSNFVGAKTKSFQKFSPITRLFQIQY